MQTNVIETMFNVILNHYNVMYNIVQVPFPYSDLSFLDTFKKISLNIILKPLVQDYYPLDIF